eukprot:5682483-Pleurochrysis_carterae.AAC.1
MRATISRSKSEQSKARECDALEEKLRARDATISKLHVQLTAADRKASATSRSMKNLETQLA